MSFNGIGLFAVRSFYGGYLQSYTGGEMHASNRNRHTEETWILYKNDYLNQFALQNYENGKYLKAVFHHGDVKADGEEKNLLTDQGFHWKITQKDDDEHRISFQNLATKKFLDANPPGKDTKYGGEVSATLDECKKDSCWWFIDENVTKPEKGGSFLKVVAGVVLGAAGAAVSVATGGITAPLLAAALSGGLSGGILAATTGAVSTSVTMPLSSNPAPHSGLKPVSRKETQSAPLVDHEDRNKRPENFKDLIRDISGKKFNGEEKAQRALSRWTDEVAWQETKHQNIEQVPRFKNAHHPGRGYFQYEIQGDGGSGANVHAIRRAINWYATNYGNAPTWLSDLKDKDIDFTTLSFDQQRMIFILDKMADKGTSFSDIVSNFETNNWDETSRTNWVNGHWKGKGTPPNWTGNKFENK